MFLTTALKEETEKQLNASMSSAASVSGKGERPLINLVNCYEGIDKLQDVLTVKQTNDVVLIRDKMGKYYELVKRGTGKKQAGDWKTIDLDKVNIDIKDLATLDKNDLDEMNVLSLLNMRHPKFADI